MAATVTIPLEPVTSSRLAAIGYDADSFTLAVRFPPTKKAPAGKVYCYTNVSEEIFDDLKNAESIGQFFNEAIAKNPEKYPFACVDEGIGDGAPGLETPAADAALTAPAEVLPAEVPDDADGLKSRAMVTRTEATAITITTVDECELASREVLRIRAERKAAIDKINRIKEPATAAWKAACALFNEVDSRYAEAEKFLDDGIIAYRAMVKRQEAERLAAEQRRQAEEAERARKAQQDEFERQRKAAEEEASRMAKQLSEQDAAEAQSRGASEEEIQQIIDNPLPVTVRHVVPPPLAYVPAPVASIEPLAIPKVSGLSYTTEYFFTITDESLIPLTHEFYSLDEKKIRARVDSMKQHANIPGVLVQSREVPRKNTARAK